MTLSPAARLIAIAPALAILAGLAVAAVRAGSADAIVNEASREMGAWWAARTPPGTDTWNWVREDLERAAARSESAAVRELLGAVHVRRRDSAEHLEAALAHFTRSLVLRPTSPYTWAQYLEARYWLGAVDERFEAALRNAALLGPAEAEVQRTVAEYGLATWDEVAPATRAAVERMLGAGLRRNPAEMLQIAQRRGRLALACRLVTGIAAAHAPNWSLICQSTEATS